MNLQRGLETLIVAVIIFVCGRGLRRLLLARGLKEDRVRLIVVFFVMIALAGYFILRVW